MEDTCPICYDIMDNTNKCTLECNHNFHSECLKLSFKSITSNNTYYNNIKKECPYCRLPVNTIPLKVNQIPIPGLHYTEGCCMEILLSGKNKNKICNKKVLNNGICSHHSNNKQCECFYKSGKNKGKRCTTLTKNIYDGKYLCGRHHKVS